MPIRTVMDGAEGLTGRCKACGTTLERAVVREVRHYEETRLLEVTCWGSEPRSLTDLFLPGDLDLPDAA